MTGPRIAWLDIETAPHLTLTYETRNVFLGLDQIIEPGRMLCFANRWSDGNKTEFYAEWQPGGRARMLDKAREILNTADVIGTFNGIGFDEPYIRAELLSHDSSQVPRKPAHLDLWRQLNGKNYRFASSKLDFLVGQLIQNQKVQHASMYRMYRDLMWGTEKQQAAVKRVYRKYNIQDVDLMPALFEEARGWIKTPNANLFNTVIADDDETDRKCDRLGCPDPVGVRRGYKTLLTGVYREYQCRGCGGWFRGTKRVGSVDTVQV